MFELTKAINFSANKTFLDSLEENNQSQSNESPDRSHRSIKEDENFLSNKKKDKNNVL